MSKYGAFIGMIMFFGLSIWREYQGNDAHTFIMFGLANYVIWSLKK